jgi:hypothetical protein
VVRLSLGVTRYDSPAWRWTVLIRYIKLFVNKHAGLAQTILRCALGVPPFEFAQRVGKSGITGGQNDDSPQSRKLVQRYADKSLIH